MGEETKKTFNNVLDAKQGGALERKSGQRAAAREVLGVVECSGTYKDLKCVGVGVVIVSGSMRLPHVVSK